MGIGVEAARPGSHIPIELCGGTHVSATGDIGLVRVLGEARSARGFGVWKL